MKNTELALACQAAIPESSKGLHANFAKESMDEVHACTSLWMATNSSESNSIMDRVHDPWGCLSE